MDSPDPEKANWLIRGAMAVSAFATASAATFLAMWKSHGKRISTLEEDMKGKVSNDELKRVRNANIDLFKAQIDIREDMNRGFQTVTKAVHDLELAVERRLKPREPT